MTSNSTATVHLAIGAAISVAIGAALACGGSARKEVPQEEASSTDAPSGGAATPEPGQEGVADGQAIGTAVFAGRVRFTGDPPPRREIRMSGEAACHRPGGEKALTEDVLVNPDGTLRNVWVRVVGGLGNRVFAPPAGAVEVDQKGCLFAPHVLMARAGQSIRFANSDPVMHNINALAKVNRGFNLSLPRAGMNVSRTFAKPEAVRIKCDVHTWMGAWIVVHDNPFQALTGDDGAFEIAGLPEGSYVVEAWHETLGSARQAVNVADGERREFEFSFSRPAR
jgi:plastocyanin